MADPDSCSMTPPCSPILELAGGELPEWVESPPKKRREEADPDTPVCFACLGEVVPTQGQTAHSQGYLQQGQLERLLKTSDSRLPESSSITTELFGHQFVTQLAMDESMDALFYLCRQQVDQTADIGRISSSGKSLLSLRQHVRRFFTYMKAFVLRYSSEDVVSTDCFVQRLLRHLQALLLYTGHIHELPSHVITSAASRLGNQSALPSYHTFHMHLDVRWSLIEMMHILSIKFPEACGSIRLYEAHGDDLSDTELFGQLVRLTLWDIVKLALTTHAKMSVNDYRRQTPFTCGCVKELLVLLIKLLQHHHNRLAKQSFWGSLYPIIQTVLARHDHNEQMEADCSQFSIPPDYACPDPVGFCWWLLLHVAPLYKYDDYGVYKDSTAMDAGQNYFALQTLLKTMMTNRLSEGQLRCYLRCCLSLSQLWGPNPDIIGLLWEHFYKRLNEHFRPSGLGLEGLASMCKTPSAWLDQCRQMCSGDESKLDSDSSFNLFLRMLAVHLMSPPGGKSNNTWNRTKGRFYTKFHARRMQELTEVGLVNFSSLFLTLAMATDTDDVVNRMCNLLASMVSIDVTRRATTWRALFTAILLYIETSRDIGFIADKLVQAFDAICSELGVAGLESSRYTELSSLLSQYLDATQEVLEMSNSFSLSQHKLLGSGLKDILKVCRENELRSTLSFCQAVLSKLRMFDARNNSETSGGQSIQSTADRMWLSVLPFTKTHACTETPPPHIADVAASFALMSLNSPPSIDTGMKEDFIGLFQYFGWNDHVNTSISCRFLCHLLPNHSAMERLSVALPNHETCLIAAWFRCCWLLPSDNDQLTELTRLVLKLREVRQMFADSDMEIGETSNAVHDFVLVLGKKYSSMTDLRQKMEFQTRMKQMLGDVSKHITHALRPGAGDELQTAYLLGGLLAKHCAQLLYVKSRPDCVFPMLLERLALPRILLQTNKPVPPQILSAIRQNLYLYVQGMSKLDFRRDPYIQRKVKEMVMQYLPRFPIKSSMSISTATVHPLVAAVSESCVTNPTQDAILFRHHVLNVVCCEFMTSQRPTTPTNPQLGLAFIAEVVNQTKKPSVIASDGRILMPPVLEATLQNDAQATAILKQTLSACAKGESQPFRSEVSHALELLVTRNLMGQSTRVMRTLELVSERCPSLLVPLIPVLTGAVRTTETKRGVGLDKQLRVAYFAVLANLGEEGQSEKSSLLASSNR